MSDIQEEQRATCIGTSTMGSSVSDTQEEKRASCIGISTTTTFLGGSNDNTEVSSKGTASNTNEEKEYQLIFTRNHYDWNEIQSIRLPSAEKQQQLSSKEDKILLYLTSNKKYKLGTNKKNFDWRQISKDFSVWCKYFSLHSLGVCHFFEREQQSLRDRFKNLNREATRK